MKTLAQVLAGTAGGGGAGYVLADGLDPLVPFLLVIAGCLFLAAVLGLLVEKDARRG